MADYGFVYILTNEYMPDVYKVGCTERSPHARAEELSKPTGVPAPFNVLCYIECQNFQEEERNLHQWLADYRISNSREFFHEGLEYAVRLLYWHPRRFSFCAPEFVHDMGALKSLAYEGLFGPDTISVQNTEDPYMKPRKVEQSAPEAQALTQEQAAQVDESIARLEAANA